MSLLHLYSSRAVNVGSIQENGSTLVQCAFFWEQRDGIQSYGYGSRFHCVVRLIIKPLENQATFLLSFPYTAQSLHGFDCRIENLLPLFYSLYKRLKSHISIPFEQVEYILHDGYHFSFAVPLDADRHWTLPMTERFRRFQIPELLATPLKAKERLQRHPSTPAPCELLPIEVVQQCFQPFTLWPVQSVIDSLELRKIQPPIANKIVTTGDLDKYWITTLNRSTIEDCQRYATVLNWKNPTVSDQLFQCVVRIYMPRLQPTSQHTKTIVLVSQLDFPHISITPHLDIIINAVYQLFINKWCCLPENIDWYLHTSEVHRWYESGLEQYERLSLNWVDEKFCNMGLSTPVDESSMIALVQPFSLPMEPLLFLIPSPK